MLILDLLSAQLFLQSADMVPGSDDDKSVSAERSNWSLGSAERTNLSAAETASCSIQKGNQRVRRSLVLFC